MGLWTAVGARWVGLEGPTTGAAKAEETAMAKIARVEGATIFVDVKAKGVK